MCARALWVGDYGGALDAPTSLLAGWTGVAQGPQSIHTATLHLHTVTCIIRPHYRTYTQRILEDGPHTCVAWYGLPSGDSMRVSACVAPLRLSPCGRGCGGPAPSLCLPTYNRPPGNQHTRGQWQSLRDVVALHTCGQGSHELRANAIDTHSLLILA